MVEAMFEIAISASVIASIVSTVLAGALAWGVVFMVTFVCAMFTHGNQREAPAYLAIGTFAVGPLIAVAVMIAMHTIRITWTA